MIRARKPGLILPKKRELLTRRSFLRGLGAIVCAPAIVRAQSIGGESGLHGGKVKSGGGGGYVAKAVHFDGATTINTTDTSAPMGVDAPTGLFSCWLNGADIFNVNVGGDILLCRNTSIGYSNAANQFDFVFGDPTATNIIFANVDTLLSAAHWNWLGMAWDTNHDSGARIVQVFIGDTQSTFSLLRDDGVAFNVSWSSVNWGLASCSESGGSQTTCDMADYQLWTNTGGLVDLTVQANRRNFIDASGKPVNPTVAAGAYGAPTVLLSGDAAGFPTNHGSGPATSVNTGTLTNATTSPSD